ncbi:hypothetical protein QBC47DRAFT_299596 [Echria macrotheca]|uniref:Rab-GAP TBC domain-containing protein n=1 Tax=Echria macrotheca TaxID=438768 RepID=A0AAJ0F9K3_9PEZI|nr:hypothetical protein QBC47DRAFT_299596 [Echria macrotheca]
MANRESDQPAPASPVRPQRPNLGPWLKHEDSNASELPLQQKRNNRRLQIFDGSHSPFRPSSPSQQHPILRSPRWDTRSAGSSPIASRFPGLKNGVSQRTRAESSPTPRRGPRSAFPGFCSNPFIPEAIEPVPFKFDVPKSPLSDRQDAEQLQLTTSPFPALPVEQSLEMRQQTPTPTPTEGSVTVENFSRPRKPSIRSQTSEPPPSRHTHGNHLAPDSVPDQASNNQAFPAHTRAPSPWSRRRGLSTSSSRSTSTYSSSIPRQPSNDHIGSSRRESVRRPNPATAVPSTTLVRPTPIYPNNVVPSSNREAPPWLAAGEESRSSFRSQLTASTAQDTLFTGGTGRSSVLTKTSSITEHSIINGYARTSWRASSVQDDGPSLEDVMGMYEKGFVDSDVESTRRSRHFPDEDDDFVATGGAFTGVSRPGSAHSNASAIRTRVLEAMSDEMPTPGSLTVPEARHSTSRESRSSFRKSLLPSSLPKDMGLGFGEYMRRNRLVAQDQTKHDSAKLLDADYNDAASQRKGSSQPASPTEAVRPPSAVEIKVAEVQPSRTATPVPPVQLPMEPPEEPGSRDRYGFRKANVNVSREEYDAWDSSYSEYLARRRKKWVAYLKDNSLMTDHPNRFPARNAKTKRFIRKGIPPDWRGRAWFYYAGGPAILGKHRGVYDDLVRRAALDPVTPGRLPGKITEVKPLVVEDIEKDLHRTFPDNIRFKPARSEQVEPERDGDEVSATDPTMSAKRAAEPEIITSLRRVLHAFALYNPRIGYCQSLNFLAGLLLLFVDTEEQAFWLLNVITRVYLPGTHEMSLEGSKVDLGVFMLFLRDSLPSVWKQIGGDEYEPVRRFRGRRSAKDSSKTAGPGANDPNRLPAITLCMTAWFMSCFIGTLPIETVLRVWDVFFYEGSRTLFRVALTIFKLGESEIKAVGDPMEMFGVVQAFPRKLIDCNAVLETCFKRRNGVGHLSQDVVEERRQERRAGIRKWRAEHEAAANGTNTLTPPTSSAAGLDLAADLRGLEVHRKGTLFGKRREKDDEQIRADEVL